MTNSTTGYIFFTGKGGVGKSTSSALSALCLAQQGFEVLLLSLDPAHNLGDIFQARISDKPSRVAEHLMAAEVDQDRWTAAYLKGVQEQIERTYTYHSAFNLEQHVRILRHSPGIEEYALLLAFNHHRSRNPGLDFMVLDMPPTALSLKFFRLPALTLVWLDKLLDLRREILTKKEMITTVQLGRKSVQTDKVLNKLEAQQQFYGQLRDIFTDPGRTSVHLVLNPDNLSRAEGRRIVQSLQEIDIPVSDLLYNKCTDTDSLTETRECFLNNQVHRMPLSENGLEGLERLHCYLADNADLFAFLNRPWTETPSGTPGQAEN